MRRRCCLSAPYEFLNYGETGFYWEGESLPSGYVWFLADSREQAIAIPSKYLFT